MKPIFLLAALLAPVAALAQTVTAPLDGVAIVTVRTEGGLQVTETRRAALASGINRVELPGVSPKAGSSLQSRFLGPGAVEVFEQSQRLASGAPDLRAVLRRYVGKTVTLLRPASEKTLAGTLLQADGAILLDTAEGVLVDPTGTYLVPRDGGPLAAPDAVVLGVAASAGGDYRVETNYLLGEGAWSANYRATQNAAGDRLELRGFAALQLPFLSYPAARLVLEPQKGDGTLQPLVARPVDLSRGARQVAFFGATIPVATRNVFRAPGEFTQDFDGAPQLVLRSLAPIGADLPSGPLSLYREREKLPPEALSLNIAATPAEQPLQIALGDVPGLAVSRRVVKNRQLSPVTREYTIEITLTNTSKISQSIEVIESLPLNFKITEVSPQAVVSEKERTLGYSVTVAPNTSTVLRYVVESKTG